MTANHAHRSGIDVITAPPSPAPMSLTALVATGLVVPLFSLLPPDRPWRWLTLSGIVFCLFFAVQWWVRRRSGTRTAPPPPPETAPERQPLDPAYYRAIIDSSLDMIIAADPQRRIVEFNKAAERTYGYRANEVLGKPIDPLYADPEEMQRVGEVIQRTGRFIGEVRGRRKDGDLFPAFISATLLRDPQERIIGSVGSSRDLSHQRQQEKRERLAIEEAQVASQAKSAFLANMSHEIRSPMNAIIGMTDLLLGVSLSTREQRQYLEVIMRSGESLLGLLNGILDYSKIEAGKLELETFSFDPAEVVESACETLSVTAHGKGLELIHDLDPELPPRLLGDPLRLRQVIVNLVDNAIRFTREGEVKVSLTPDRSEPTGNGETGGAITLRGTVTDTGIGIEGDRLEAIFSHFSQAGVDTSRKFGGSGLGLTISRQLIEHMGGTIRAESPGPGRGSTFHFSLTLDRDPQAERREAPADFSGCHFLLAVGNDALRRVLNRSLAPHGPTLTNAANAGDTLNALRDTDRHPSPFTLLIIDCQLPGLDTANIGGWIRTHRQRVGNTIILLPMGSRRYDLPGCRDLDVARGLIKPVKREALIRTLREVLEPVHAAEPEPARPERDENDGPEKILVVDDNIDTRTLARHILEQAGHAVETAENGADCLEKLSRAPFDLVLMDVQMPELDGLEAARAIRGGRLGIDSKTPILAISAGVLPEDVEQCLEAGMNEFLPKPFRSDALLEAMRHTLDKAKRTAPTEDRSKGSANARRGPVFQVPILSPQPLDNPDFLAIARTFRETIDDRYRDLQSALTAGLPDRVEITARTIKEEAGRLGAERVHNRAFRQILAARNRDLDTVRQLMPRLRREIDEVIATLADQPPPPGQ